MDKKALYVQPAFVLTFLGVLLAACLVMAAAIGTIQVPVIHTGGIILKKLGIINWQTQAGWESIIFYVRLPRVLLAALAGASLSVSGAVMQGMFRNPMADPGILGVSSGAGLGAVASIALGLAYRSLFMLPLFASAGAIAASLLIFMLAYREGKIPVMNLLLSGLAVSMFLSAITTVILMFISGDHVKQFIFWTVGSFNSSRWESLQLVFVPCIISIAVLMFMARKLNILLLGEEEARAVGLNPQTSRIILILFSSIATAAAVAVSGIISFAGLIVPHILRMITGPDHRVLLPASALGGAIFLVVCDLIGRTIMIPREINVGIVTSIIGAPYFIFLLNRARSKGSIFG